MSPSTVNHGLKFARMLFGAARKEGLIAENPAEDVPILKRDTKSTRRPFTVSEVKALIATADDEWQSMILFALYSGQRLGDIATLTWEQIDLEAGEIRLQTGKTERFQKIPIPSPLLKHIQSLPNPGHEQTPCTPGRKGSLPGRARPGRCPTSSEDHGQGRSGGGEGPQGDCTGAWPGRTEAGIQNQLPQPAPHHHKHAEERRGKPGSGRGVCWTRFGGDEPPLYSH